MEKQDNARRMYEAFMKARKEQKENLQRNKVSVDYTLPDRGVIERTT